MVVDILKPLSDYFRALEFISCLQTSTLARRLSTIAPRLAHTAACNYMSCLINLRIIAFAAFCYAINVKSGDGEPVI